MSWGLSCEWMIDVALYKGKANVKEQGPNEFIDHSTHDQLNCWTTQLTQIPLLDNSTHRIWSTELLVNSSTL